MTKRIVHKNIYYGGQRDLMFKKKKKEIKKRQAIM